MQTRPDPDDSSWPRATFDELKRNAQKCIDIATLFSKEDDVFHFPRFRATGPGFGPISGQVSGHGRFRATVQDGFGPSFINL